MGATSGGTLGRTLQRLRQRAGLTQQEAAAVTGLSVAGLRDVEQGRVTRPRPQTLRRLGLALGLGSAETEELVQQAQRTHPERHPTAAVWIGVLGPLVVTVDGREVDLGSENQRALLGILALSPNVPVGREALAEAAWGGSVAPDRADVLPSRISRLRRRLRPADGAGTAPALESVGSGYRLAVSGDQLDLLAFRDLIRQARHSRDRGELAGACDLFAAALRQWRAGPLAGSTTLAEHPTVVELARTWQSVVVEYATVAIELGRHEEVVPLLRQVTEQAPLHEPAHARLVVALASSGQNAAALAAFGAARRRLAAELGAPPGPELAEAHLRVLRHEVPQPHEETVRAHRQLPPDIADFSGRRAELDWLCGQLPDGSRTTSGPTVLAIEGLGGVGKTRLALHFAHRLLATGQYADQQLYVDLRGYAEEPPADPATVLASFLRLLGVPDEEVPAGLAARTSLYRGLIRSGKVLVLLDNAAGSEQVTPLLPAGPGSLALVTSRRALPLTGRTLVLDVFPPPEAVDFLGQVAGPDRVAADPAAAAEVVRRCGRLPLAVALAGRRLQSRPAWTLADLASRLADPDHRLDPLAAGTRSPRATFDLSYRALSPPAQCVFRAFGQGQGPEPELTAAAAAAATGLTVDTAQRALDHLAAEHLVTACPGRRYRIHGLLRDYALRR